ncbi:MAG: dTDP-4-dehydrorhamnose reductase [Fusobacteriaceae bacterium]
MILITGANGQLGYDLQRILKSKNREFIATDYTELDITNIDAVRNFVKDKEIKLIINCAAYNNVDLAEEEVEMCYKLNAYAPRDLAKVAKEIGAEYITYSTDFVFDGKKGSPYTEEDEVSPLSVYSRAKALGEKLTLEAYDRSFVIRTSWVFGIANNNFNRQVINWSKDRDNLSIVDDQTSSPTYSYDLALYSLKLIETKRYGLYHLSNSGEASKYDQAQYVLESIGWTGTLNRGKSSDFKLPAKRAEYSKLDSSKLEAVIGEKLPTWQSGVNRFLDEMRERGELV